MAKNILVVDDDGMVTRSLCGLLKKSGYSADASGDGFDAIEKVQDTHIDLIVIDLRMPGMDGVQTVKRIKEIIKSRNKADIPVIFITGYADSELYAQAKGLGRVLVKPLDNKDLLEGIEEYI